VRKQDILETEDPAAARELEMIDEAIDRGLDAISDAVKDHAGQIKDLTGNLVYDIADEAGTTPRQLAQNAAVGAIKLLKIDKAYDLLTGAAKKLGIKQLFAPKQAQIPWKGKK